MSSTIDLAFGIFIGYILGVAKEKMRWIEKYISSRRSQEETKELIEGDE